jgi:hypothetical protein
MGAWQKPPPLPKLSSSDVTRARAIARNTCGALGFGSIASFKQVVARRTTMGMYFPIIAVECRMKVNSTIPVHELSIPTVLIEISPEDWSVSYFQASLPVVVEQLRAKEDKEKAKNAIAEYAKKRYGLDLKPASMKVDLCLISWPEGNPDSVESKKLRFIRRWLIPIYEYDLPKIGQIWFNANTMKLLGVREVYPQLPTSTKRPPP